MNNIIEKNYSTITKQKKKNVTMNVSLVFVSFSHEDNVNTCLWWKFLFPATNIVIISD